MEQATRAPVPPPRPWAPYVIALTAAALSLFAAWYVWQSGRHGEWMRFEAAIDRTTQTLRDRINTYTVLLRGVEGFMTASDYVTAEEFRAYVERLNLPANYPGVQGIGLALKVAPDEVADLEKRMRSDGFPDFRIMPGGPRDTVTAIIHIEPLDRRNRAAIGYDMFSEPVRRAAMEKARDDALPAASGRVTLVQEIDPQTQPGFLIYLPLYRGALTPATAAERRAAIIGWVYSPFRIDDLFSGIFGEREPGLRLRVTDLKDNDAGPLFESVPHSADGASAGALTDSRIVGVAGRQWRLDLLAGEGFQTESTRTYAKSILLGGLAIGGLLFWLSRGQVLAREAAEAAAAGLRRSESELRLSEERFRMLVDQSPLTIQVFDPDGRVSQSNRAWETLWGAPRDALADYNLFHDAEAIRLGVGDLARRALAGENVVFGPLHYDPAATGATGRDRWVEGTMYPIRLPGGQVDEIVLILRDVSERIAAETERADLLSRERDARRDAEAANRLKDEFLATVSHELRTPLNAIMGWAQVLETLPDSPDGDLPQATEAILRNARAQARLVDDLLDVSRIISGKLRLDVRPTDLRKVIDAAVETTRPAASAKAIDLRWAPPSNPVEVACDPNRVQQVLWNLLTNAIKFTPRGGRVEVALDRHPDAAVITVRDTGDGIDAAFLPHVFNAFRQADSSSTRSHGGLGLGLAIVRHLVEQHGGAVHVASDGHGRGATFTVHLPITPTTDSGDAPSTAAPPTKSPLDGLRVLVVDDDPDARVLIERILSKAGAAVRVEPDAEAALSTVASWHPSVLLADIAMPGHDGHWLIGQLRRLPRDHGAATPSAAVTALGRVEDRNKSLATGFDAHLSKPVDPPELIALVARLAGRTAGA